MSNKDSGFDGEVEIKIPKKETQVYWPEIIKSLNPATDYVWKSVHDFYLDELKDIMPAIKDQSKTKKAKKETEKAPETPEVEELTEANAETET